MDAKDLTVAETMLPINPDSGKTIEELTSEIQYYLVKMGQNAIEAGKRLILAKAKLQHGEWQNWLADNFNLSYKMAAKFMQVAERFSKVSTSRLFSQSQMFEMLSLPESETEKFIEVRALEGTPVDSMSIKKLREEIKKYKTGLSESKQEKSVEVETAANMPKVQMSVVFNEAEKIEMADVDLEIENDEVEEKVEEMTLESSDPLSQEEDFVGVENSAKERDLEPLEQLFKVLPLILSRLNLKSEVENYAAKDLKGLEEQLCQLAAVHTEIENCLENWKNNQGVEIERQAIIKELKQIALNDKDPFKKSKYIRDSVSVLGFESVHKVPTKELLKILNEVKTQ